MRTEKELLEYLHEWHPAYDLNWLTNQIISAVNMLTANHRPDDGYAWKVQGNGFKWKLVITTGNMRDKKEEPEV